MKNTLIFGNSGAGKSTLAKKLKAESSLEHLDLDVLAWLDTNPPTRKPIVDSKKEIDLFLSKSDSWVIEGGYSDLLELVTEQASNIVFLNPPVDICIQHCKSRPWEPHKYATKTEQDKNLSMLIEWVKQYEHRDDDFSLKSHRALYEKFSGHKQEINSGVDSLIS